MPEQTTYNNECPVCKQNYLTVVEDEQTLRGACQACGHTFSEWKNQSQPEQPQPSQPAQPLPFVDSGGGGTPSGAGASVGIGGMFGQFLDMFTKISGIVAIVAIVLVIATSVVISGGIGDVDNRVTTVKDSLDSKIDGVKDDISTINADISDLETNVGDITNDINDMKEDVDDIPNMIDDISALKDDRDEILGNITTLEDDVEALQSSGGTDVNPDVNVTFFYDTNQSNTTTERNCTVKLTVEDDDMHHIIYAMSYNYTNITLNSWSAVNTKPETYQWTNDSCDDNYKITWVENTDRIVCVFEVKWRTDMYNTTILPSADLKHVLYVDGYYINIPEIWEVEEDL